MAENTAQDFVLLVKPSKAPEQSNGKVIDVGCSIQFTILARFNSRFDSIHDTFDLYQKYISNIRVLLTQKGHESPWPCRWIHLGSRAGCNHRICIRLEI